MAAALGEGQMLMLVEVVNALGGEHADRLGKPVREIGHLDTVGDLSLRAFGRVQDGVLALDQGPLERLLGAVDVEALTVLPGRIEE